MASDYQASSLEREAMVIVKQAFHAYEVLKYRFPLSHLSPSPQNDGIVTDEDGAYVIGGVSPEMFMTFSKTLDGAYGELSVDIPDPDRLPFEYNSKTHNLNIYPCSDMVHETLVALVQELAFVVNESTKGILPAGYKIRQHGKSRHTLILGGGKYFMVKEPDGGLLIMNPNGSSGDFTVVVESAVARSYHTMLQSLVAWSFAELGVKLCVITYLTAPKFPHDYYDYKKWLGFVETWLPADRDAKGEFVRGQVHISSANNILDSSLAQMLVGPDGGVTYEHEGYVIKRLVRRDCVNIPADASNDALLVPIHMQYILGDNISGLKAQNMPEQSLNISMRELESDIRGALVSMEHQMAEMKNAGLTPLPLSSR